MIGDVNLFLKGRPPHMRGISTRSIHSAGEENEEEEDFEAELEIMIAGAFKT